MLDFLLAPAMLPFTVALGVMGMIGLLEAVGIGAGAVHLDADVDGDAGHLLSWLGIGEVPLLIVLVVLLALFALIGMSGQQLAAALLGAPLSPWLAAPIAFVAALPLTGGSARLLARILPHDETTAVPLDSLVGRRATIVVGTAAPGSPARAQVRDVHGQPHYVMVEPMEDGPAIGEGESVLLVERLGETFIGLSEGGSPLAAIDRPFPTRI